MVFADFLVSSIITSLDFFLLSFLFSGNNLAGFVVCLRVRVKPSYFSILSWALPQLDTVGEPYLAENISPPDSICCRMKYVHSPLCWKNAVFLDDLPHFLSSPTVSTFVVTSS